MANHQETQRINGTIYIPAKPYNAYQMWKEYEPEVIERDLEYARSIQINALRIWFSYEYWLEDRNGIEKAYEHFLKTAAEKGMLVLPSLFEKCGIEPTEEAKNDKNPLTAVCISSPAKEIYENPERYADPAEYIKWFIDRYKNDARHLAIEVMNEPIGKMRIHFAREMLKAAKEQQGSLPLTIGCINIEDNVYFLDIGIDILQHHMNFPKSKEWIEQRLRKVIEAGELLNKPVWLTEWQRIRTISSGWGEEQLEGNEWQPDYAAYAEILKDYPEVGTFFWSLMIKAAYLPPQRKKATLNGVFHEDGSVWSLQDARAISGNANLQIHENKEWPEWLKDIPEAYMKK